MKKIIILAVLVIAALVAGYLCGYIGDSATYLKVEPDSLVFGKAGGEQKVLVSTDARRWTIKWCPEWTKAEKKGDTLIFNCQYTETKTTNYDTLYLQAADKQLAIPVKQYGKATFITFSPDTLVFPQSGGTMKAIMHTDGGKIRGLNESNLDVKINGEEVTVTAAANDNRYARDSYIIIRSDQLEGRLYYHQEGTGKSNVVIKKVTPCPECGGLGKLLTSVNMGTGEKTYAKCTACNGTGKAPRQ